MSIPERVDAGQITLLRWTLDRAEDLDQAINESMPELMSFMPWATADHTFEATTSYLVQSEGDWDKAESFNYAMVTRQGLIAGSGSLMARQGPGVLEIGYWVRSSHCGRGYATAAATALAEVGLAQPGIDRVQIHHDTDNPASGRIAAKAGFHEVGPIDAPRKALQDSGTHLVWARHRTEQGA